MQYYSFQSLAMCFNVMYEQYSNFVGMPHIGAIVRLCGYQDVAVIITELLEVVNSSVSKSRKIPFYLMTLIVS